MKKDSITTFTITKRHLPHWQLPNSVYFITTRCINDVQLLPEHRDIVMNSIHYLNGKKCKLYAAVVLPDHFHLIIQPTEKSKDRYYSLSEIMHNIKGFTAHTFGKPTWQHEYFDRIVRDNDELFEKINYIINNPIKAGLAKERNEYKWLYYISKDDDTSGQPSPVDIIILPFFPIVAIIFPNPRHTQ